MKLNNKHFEYFKERCQYWQEKFGLIDWEIDYEFEFKEGSRGRCLANYMGRVATISLSTKQYGNEKEINESINKTAFHEMVELLLSPLTACAQDRVWDKDVYERENHSVIRVLEHLFLKET